MVVAMLGPGTHPIPRTETERNLSSRFDSTASEAHNRSLSDALDPAAPGPSSTHRTQPSPPWPSPSTRKPACIQVRRRMPTFVSDEQFERAGEETTVEENLSRVNFVRKTR